MSRTYQTSDQYDAACRRLAAHLSTLTADEISGIYLDGYTEDADGTIWRPARDHILEPDAQATWFVEAHGAAARYDGHRWHAGQPGETELTGHALAIWGEECDDLGYPVAGIPGLDEIWGDGDQPVRPAPAGELARTAIEIGTRVRFAGAADPSEIDMSRGSICPPPDGRSSWTWVRWDSLPGIPLAHRASDLREIEEKEMTEGQYVIARAVNAGVFAGTLADGGELGDGIDRRSVTLTGARRLWYWEGAASLSQLATTGTSKPDRCKFPAPVSVVTLNDICELLAVSDTARRVLEDVPAWEA